jgi:hypothetical protein
MNSSSARTRLGGPRRERSFGLSVGTVLVLIAIALVWRGRVTRAEIIGGVGVVLVFFGYVRPAVLKIPSDAWWAFASVLGWINARVLLSLAFFLVLTPLGAIWRLTGRDPMSRRRSSYGGWNPYPERYRDGKHLDNMF